MSGGLASIGAPPAPSAAEFVYLEAFWGCGRQIGFSGPQPIQPSEVAAWLDLRGFDDRAFRAAVWRVVHALDGAFLAHYAQKAASKGA